MKRLHKQGVTLVEMLISMVILAILVVVLLYGFNTGHLMAKSITYHSSAINLAQELVETIMADSYNNVTTLNYSGLADVTVSDGIVMNRTVTVSAEYNYPGTAVPCKDVLVTIGWTEDTRNLTESIYTIVTNTP